MEGRVEGYPRNPTLLGTKTLLYVEIFCSSVASLRCRITYAATVTHFLVIWHDHILHNERLSRETYQDIVISCQFAVILICYKRDNFLEKNVVLS